mgnify:CR=1 FL=1
MISNTQCEIARKMTNTNTTDVQIQCEYATLTEQQKNDISAKIDGLIRAHSGPIDTAYPEMVEDFRVISTAYGVSSATTFCIYMAHAE